MRGLGSLCLGALLVPGSGCVGVSRDPRRPRSDLPVEQVRSDQHHLVRISDLSSERVEHGFLSDKVLLAATVSGEVAGPDGMSPELQRIIAVRKSTGAGNTYDVELVPVVQLRKDPAYRGETVAFRKRVEMYVPFVGGSTEVRFLCGGKESRAVVSLDEKVGPLMGPRP